MADDDVVPSLPPTVRRRPRRARSKSFKGSRFLFTSNISGYNIQVYQQKEAMDGDAVGYWDPESHEIGVTLPAPSPAAEADRVLHEHLHAISVIVLPPEIRLNEFQVNALSTTLIDVLARNSEFRNFILSRVTPVPV